ncbi:MAG: orotate phosphoribosyltransferase [Burkholderiaceae bacterium]
MSNLRQDFIEFAVRSGVLMFGEFVTKAGRQSPYFFNAGLFHHGGTLAKLSGFYAKTLLAAERDHGLKFDLLFGPAYKGITLASATAIALAQVDILHGGRDIPFAFNRKEAKDHGEKGIIIGAKLAGNVVIVDDVVSAGTSVRESVQIIRQAGANPAAVLIALDRQERGGDAVNVSAMSAVQEVERDYGIPVVSIANLDDIMSYLELAATPELASYQTAVAQYRARYGVAG